MVCVFWVLLSLSISFASVRKVLAVCIAFLMTTVLFASEAELLDRQFADDMMRLAGFDKFPQKSARVKWAIPKRFMFEGEEYLISHKDRGLYVYKTSTEKKNINFRITVEFGESIHSMLYSRCMSCSRSAIPYTVADWAKLPQLIVDDQTVVVYSKRGISAKLFHNNMYIELWNTSCDAKELALALLYAGLKEVETNGQVEATKPEVIDED